MSTARALKSSPSPDFPAGGKGHVHFVGICGIGMAGLAWLLKRRGYRVTGCDQTPNALAGWLRRKGIRVAAGHDAAHLVPSVRSLIRSPAVPMSAGEIRAARSRRIPVFDRGRVLPRLLEDGDSIAVGGTHGKTTTTSFITQILKQAGRDPGWCIGGEVESLGGVSDPGGSKILVVEADESDGTLALYKPTIAVITNIEFDHMEHFADVAAFRECFRRFALHARRKIVFSADDPGAYALGREFPDAISFGLSARAALRATRVTETSRSLHFLVSHRGKNLGFLRLPMAGRHNIRNALAATGAALECGVSFREIRAAFRKIQLPKRRFEKVVEKRGITVVSDYAHHPTEVAALVQMARQLKPRRLIAVFQPHRYTRTLALGKDFPGAFEGVDELVLTPVYAASEKPLPGGSAWDLYEHFRAGSVAPRPDVFCASSLEGAWAYLRRKLGKGVVLLIVGAGDILKMTGWAKQEFEKHPPAGRKAEIEGLRLSPQTVVRRDEPLARKTTLRVGGSADLWMEIFSRKDLKAVLRWANRRNQPVTLLGAGSNVLISDLGLRGVTLRLTGPEFRSLRLEKDRVVAGAALPLTRLVDVLAGQGFGGLEFLDGIPGSVGGALHMNAGAWGRAIGNSVEWIRCLNSDGTECIVQSSDLHWGYRECRGLQGKIVLEAEFKVCAESVAVLRERRKEISERRRWMKGLRCAGSIFKNPGGHPAGYWIEQAGFKGVIAGGARVSERHANFIVTEPGARASDVKALIERIRTEVLRRFGVALETEVVFLE